MLISHDFELINDKNFNYKIEAQFLTRCEVFKFLSRYNENLFENFLAECDDRDRLTSLANFSNVTFQEVHNSTAYADQSTKVAQS